MPKVVSNIRRLANRPNARSSTGHTTPEGRAKSAPTPPPDLDGRTIMKMNIPNEPI